MFVNLICCAVNANTAFTRRGVSSNSFRMASPCCTRTKVLTYHCHLLRSLGTLSNLEATSETDSEYFFAGRYLKFLKKFWKNIGRSKVYLTFLVLDVEF